MVLWNSVVNYDSIDKKWLADEKKKVKKSGYILRNNFKIGKKLFDEMSKLKPWKELKKLKIPILFIHGDKDSQVLYSDSVMYAKMLNSRLVTIHGAEHGFHDSKKHAELADQAAIKFFLQNI